MGWRRLSGRPASRPPRSALKRREGEVEGEVEVEVEGEVEVEVEGEVGVERAKEVRRATRFVPRFGWAKEPLLRWVRVAPRRRRGVSCAVRPRRSAAFRWEPRMKLPGRRMGS
jgi:hypothetical protein